MPVRPSASFEALNLRTDRFTSGGRKAMPCLRQYCVYMAILGALPATEFISAAMNSTG